MLNASGRAGAGADPDRLRAEGETGMPLHGDVRAVTVPGCVDGWVALHARFGRLELGEVLEPARRLAADGFAASPALVRAAPRTARPRSQRRARARSCGGPGSRRALAAITRDGRKGFYAGPFGEALLALGGTSSAPPTSSGRPPTGSSRSGCASGAARAGPCRRTRRAT